MAEGPNPRIAPSIKGNTVRDLFSILCIYSHQSTAMRASIARLLHLLADRIGVNLVFKAGKNFLYAISKMSLDASPEVRFVT